MHAATRVGVGYNIQIAVDAKHKLIAEQQVHNKVSDLGLLAETAVAARRNLAVNRIDAVADAGYFKIEDIEACENAGVVPHVPKPQRGSTVSQGLFPKERFRYDGGEDIYICPDGQRLALHSKRKRRDLFFASYANRAACKECQLKSKCTKSAFRRILRYVDEAILERMAERLAARPELLDARRESVEHPFGSIKQWMGQGAFLTRRLENVRGEFSITALAYQPVDEVFPGRSRHGLILWCPGLKGGSLMALGQQKDRQGDLMVSWSEMPRSPGHVFYDRLQLVLIEGGFDGFAEAVCQPYYAARMGAPSVPPGRYFRMHLVGYFEGIDSERGLEWRCSARPSPDPPRRSAPGPSDPEAKIAKMKDGTTHLAYKPEHAVDLDTGAVVAAELHPADEGDTTTLPKTLAAAEANLEAVDVAPTAEDPAECVTDKGYHSRLVLKALDDGPWKSRISEPKQKGFARWHGDDAARRAVTNNRTRLLSGVAREAFKLRAEIVERSFAHNLDRGGMRRTWLRGRENVHKRYLLHVAGHNLSLLMRQLIGAGTPKEAVAGGIGALFVLVTPAGAVLVVQIVLIVSEDGETAFAAICFAVA